MYIITINLFSHFIRGSYCQQFIYYHRVLIPCVPHLPQPRQPRVDQFGHRVVLLLLQRADRHAGLLALVEAEPEYEDGQRERGEDEDVEQPRPGRRNRFKFRAKNGI